MGVFFDVWLIRERKKKNFGILFFDKNEINECYTYTFYDDDDTIIHDSWILFLPFFEFISFLLVCAISACLRRISEKRKINEKKQNNRNRKPSLLKPESNIIRIPLGNVFVCVFDSLFDSPSPHHPPPHHQTIFTQKVLILTLIRIYDYMYTVYTFKEKQTVTEKERITPSYHKRQSLLLFLLREAKITVCVCGVHQILPPPFFLICFAQKKTDKRTDGQTDRPTDRQKSFSYIQYTHSSFSSFWYQCFSFLFSMIMCGNNLTIFYYYSDYHYHYYPWFTSILWMWTCIISRRRRRRICFQCCLMLFCYIIR